MIEYIALALIAFICYQDFYNRKERKRLVDAFLAKNLKELKEPETKIEPSTGADTTIYNIPLDQATPEQFDKAIRKTVGTETVVEKTMDKVKKAVKRGR